MKKIGFIGAGKMATAIIKGVIASENFKREDVFAYDINCDVLKNMQNSLGINVTTEIEEIVKNVDIVVVSTKPFVFNDVVEKIKNIIGDKLLVSILAGVSTKKYEENIENVRIIRVMPNTPALVKEGASAICKGKNASEQDADFVLNLFSKLGTAIKIEEKYIDIVTAISGSGPAFYYYFIEEIARAGEKLGLDYETCLKLSAQTAKGSAQMILEGTDTPKQLIINVTTPKGCTAVGNEVLKNHKVDEILMETIEKTMEKAHALG